MTTEEAVMYFFPNFVIEGKGFTLIKNSETNYFIYLGNDVVFKGTIKNKSELRRLMQQIGINE